MVDIWERDWISSIRSMTSNTYWATNSISTVYNKISSAMSFIGPFNLYVDTNATHFNVIAHMQHENIKIHSTLCNVLLLYMSALLICFIHHQHHLGMLVCKTWLLRKYFLIQMSWLSVSTIFNKEEPTKKIRCDKFVDFIWKYMRVYV